MALHPNFPKSPYAILDPDIRWFPADEALRTQDYGKLLPPLVATLRKKVKEWRDLSYSDISPTSKALLEWWFKKEFHPDFEYYFSQREALETVIYLTEAVKVKDKYDLLRFDSSGIVSPSMFPESWRRFVIKMATGTGKTKVLSLILAWCYFHKLYEADSTLARNFLIITPNIIVLDRIRQDFDGLKIFSEDPIIPENGYQGQNWKDDFQVTLHIQDQIGTVGKSGNIFLTNIHRVFQRDINPASPDDEDTKDYFLGDKPVRATNDSRVDLGEIIRDIDELVILNDEAHHIHDERLAWFKSIEDIHNSLLIKGGQLALQIDVTATPKHTNGSIFVQTVSDYPLVEAIAQEVVKHPVVPDPPSRAKLVEEQSSKYSERYREYINLGYLEWEKVYAEHAKMGKKAVLFVMTDDTKNCDEVAQYLENTYPSLKDSVLVIHTKDNGEISESVTGKSKEELEKLRKESNQIDSLESKHKAIVSVLMLKEGWDVRNVTTIVGLRAYSAQSNILPEQTLGRGLRRMYRDINIPEYVSVVGTDAFMEFVDSIQNEGVVLEKRSMGQGTPPIAPIVVEIDTENLNKDIEKMDIQIPVLSPRIYREYNNISNLDVTDLIQKPLPIKEYSDQEKKEITFTYIVRREGEEETVHHVTILGNNAIPNYQSVIGYFSQVIMKELRMVGGYDLIYQKVKEFIATKIFGQNVNLDDANIIKNLSETLTTRTVIESFKKKINSLTVLDKGMAEIRGFTKVSDSRPFVAKDQQYIVPKKSIFNRIIGDSYFELEFASFLDSCEDMVSYTKNYFSVHFKVDYKNADGSISDFYPDFLIKVDDKNICILETKGREDLDDPLKIQRLKLWCEDINKIQSKVKFSMLYIKQDEFEKYKPSSFRDLEKIFK